MTLTRYWIEFEQNSHSIHGLGFGCGVTANDTAEAMSLVQTRILNGAALPRVIRLVEDVDVSTLDQNHVLPNMNPPNLRGIWFPRGFDG